MMTKTIWCVIGMVWGAVAWGGTVEVVGVGAGAFEAGAWREGRLNWVADVRSPLIEPLEGKWRNIYAPSVVELPDGSWRVFYGAWDGVATGNDRIYSVTTKDWVTFEDRRVVVEHGVFQHVCNVSAVREGDGSFTLMCTAYPDEKGLNKPAVFRVAPPAAAAGPIVAGRGDLIEMEGYEKYAAGDLNGMNPIIRNERGYELYFANFKDWGHVYRAGSGDGKRFAFEGEVLGFAGMPNDVKRFGGVTVMALHQNGPALYYALSEDGGKRFGEVREMVRHLGAEDRFIVAVGFVTKGDRVLGVLYGAGAVGSLDRNRIFARWLQKRVVFVGEDGRETVAVRGRGPETAVVEVEGEVAGRVRVYGEGGERVEWESGRVVAREGEVVRVGGGG